MLLTEFSQAYVNHKPYFLQIIKPCTILRENPNIWKLHLLYHSEIQLTSVTLSQNRLRGQQG